MTILMNSLRITGGFTYLRAGGGGRAQAVTLSLVTISLSLLTLLLLCLPPFYELYHGTLRETVSFSMVSFPGILSQQVEK